MHPLTWLFQSGHWFLAFEYQQIVITDPIAVCITMNTQYRCISRLKHFYHERTCILRCRPGPCLPVTWQTRQKTATQIGMTLHYITIMHYYCGVVCLTIHSACKVTCCAVSILSLSMSSIWKPLSRTSSVEAGTVAVNGDCRDRDDRLHRSSMGSCEKTKQSGAACIHIPSLRLCGCLTWRSAS